jgi:hypothetical protein
VFGLAAADFTGRASSTSGRKLDVAGAVCGGLSGSVAILAGDSQGGLGTPMLYPAGRCPHVLRAADMDNDGDPDLIVGKRGNIV